LPPVLPVFFVEVAGCGWQSARMPSPRVEMQRRRRNRRRQASRQSNVAAPGPGKEVSSMVPGMTERERLAADVRRLDWLAEARF
jgi:hypothetical protein